MTAKSALYSAEGVEVTEAAVCVPACETSTFFAAAVGDVAFLACFFTGAFLATTLFCTATLGMVRLPEAAALGGTTCFADAFLVGFGFLAAGVFVAGFDKSDGCLPVGAALTGFFASEVTVVDFLTTEALGAKAAASALCCRAHRIRCAAAIFALPSGLIARRLGALDPAWLERVASFVRSLGRPSLCPGSDPLVLSGTLVELSSRKSPKAWVRRKISCSIDATISFVFIPLRIRGLGGDEAVKLHSNQRDRGDHFRRSRLVNTRLVPTLPFSISALLHPVCPSEMTRGPQIQNPTTPASLNFLLITVQVRPTSR